MITSQFFPNVSAHTLDVDGVVLALGSTGMKNVMRGSPELAKKAEDLSLAASLDAIDVAIDARRRAFATRARANARLAPRFRVAT